ncbi:MAG: hypothetical protein ACOCUS_05815 [Polyangiales bacterium]
MRRTWAGGAALGLVLAVSACGDGSSDPSGMDAGPEADASVDRRADRDGDASPEIDAGGDDGAVGTDGGAPDGTCPAPGDFDEGSYTDFVDPSAHYRFPLDDGWADIAPGSTHTKIYVSSSTGSDDNDGSSPDAALATLEAARDQLREGSSDWILLARGDVFGGVRFREELNGEAPEHPVVVGAYGEGPRPVIETSFRLWSTHENVAIRDIRFRRTDPEQHFHCLDVLGTITNLYIENVVTEGCESRIQGSDSPQHTGVTLRRVMILDAHRFEPADGASDWSAILDNRLSGIYVANVDGLFIEESLADHSGWEEGYDPEVGPGPHPPSKYSHNFYLQSNNRNVVLRATIAARGASFGAQVRPGGVVQRNVFVGNNAAFFTAGDEPSLVENNVVTVAGNKVAEEIGARGWGLATQNVADTVVRGNIVAHSVDPLAPIDGEDYANNPIHETGGAVTEDNVVFRWGSSPDMPADVGDAVDGDGPSIVAYARDHDAGEDLESFLDALRGRDRDNWPCHLTATAIQRYFRDGLAPD